MTRSGRIRRLTNAARLHRVDDCRLPKDPAMTDLETARLRLEPYDDRHANGLQAINGDPEVMTYLGFTETPEQTRLAIIKVKARWAELGYSWWAFVERAAPGQVVGCGCIQHIEQDPAKPIEIGWRLRRDRWHQGFAIEAARAMADFAFDQLELPRLVSIADPENLASIRVMERLGMHHIGMETHYGALCAAYAIDRGEHQRQRILAAP
jgi:RimJ/RimL family protein N-acetyltransferase